MALAFPESFARDPGLFVHQYDAATDRLLLTNVAREDFAEASFLDQRLLTPEREAGWAPWRDVAQAGSGCVADANFILHIGHVGSTLVSRLLGEAAGVLSLREPMLLRNLAEIGLLQGKPTSPWRPGIFAGRLEQAIGWLSRSYADQKRAIVKATSFVSAIAAPLLGEARKGLLLYARPATYIATILAGENSRRELAMLTPARIERLHDRLDAAPFELWELPEATRAALGWACEMRALADGRATAGADRARWLDFDAFLADPAAQLAEAAALLDVGLDAGQAEALVSGPIMRRYSKAPEHDYSPQLRADLLAQTRRERREEIASAMAWLERAARDHAPIGQLMEQVQ